MKVIQFWCTIEDNNSTSEIQGWISDLLGRRTTEFLRAYYGTEVEIQEYDYEEAQGLYKGPMDLLEVQKTLEYGRIAIQEYEERFFGGYQEEYSSGRQPRIADYLKYAVQETIGGWRQTPMFTGTFKECQKFLEERCTDSNSSYSIILESEVVVDYF